MSDSIEEMSVDVLALLLDDAASVLEDDGRQNMPKILRAAALKLRECREAIRGVLGDDDAATSLADQRARWPERMAALKRAMGE